MRTALLAVLAFAIPVAASAAPPRLPGDARQERSRPSTMQTTELRRNDQFKIEATRPLTKMPEAVKNMMKYDICTSSVANCD